MYILYSEEYKLVFIVFSRCWSKTMINWLGTINNINIENRKTHKIVAENIDLCLNSLTSNELLEKITDEYFIYIMVRNPYERLLSTTIAHKQHENLTFKEFVYKYDNHNEIIMANEKVLILMLNRNYKILYFENFKEDLNNVKEEHNIPYDINGKQELIYYNNISNYDNSIYNIKLKNFKNKIPSYNHFYTDEMKERIYNMFQIDFLTFKINK